MTKKEHKAGGSDGKDRRVTRGKADPATVQSLEGLRPIWFETQIALARDFYRMHLHGAFLFEKSASIPQFASLKGFDGENAWRLLELGYALSGLPGLEEALRDGRVVFPSACALGPVFRDPELFLREDDRWLEWAALKPLRDLRRLVRERVAEARNQPPKKLTVHADVTAETKDILLEAQKIASGKAKRLLQMGDTLDVVARSYVLVMDPTYKLPRERRLPDTAERPWSRQVPAEVVRAILKRSGGLCEFGNCERPGAELCHLHPHAEGSAREKEDLVLGCHTHHTLLDRDLLQFVTWTQDGRPLFRGTRDDALLLPKPLPEDRGRVQVPDGLVPALTPAAGRIMRRLLKKQAEVEAAGKAKDPGRQPASRRDAASMKKAPKKAPKTANERVCRKDPPESQDGASGDSGAGRGPRPPP